VLQLPGTTGWCFWLAQNGQKYHLSFLSAPVGYASQNFLARSTSLSSGVSP
jgi:hypothetical protein